MNNLILLINERIAALDPSSIVQLAAIFIALTFLYRFIYLRRSFSIAVGMVVVYGVYMVAKIFKFAYIYTVLNSFIQYGALLLILIFASELRTVFEHVGNVIVGIRQKRQEKRVATDLSEAILDLSKSGTGALIVIERKTMLEHITKTAVILDALLSKNFILNIFSGIGPLHDGAVLIRNGRIYAAACKIPDVNIINLPSHYGLRHQSSVNLSASSDALVIIVSEEDHTVSYAEYGQLRHFETEEELTDKIHEALKVRDYVRLSKKNKQKISINMGGDSGKSKSSK